MPLVVEANGSLLFSVGGVIYRRRDGPSPTYTEILNLGYRQGPDMPVLKYNFPDSHYICFPYETRRTGIERWHADLLAPRRRRRTAGERQVPDARFAIETGTGGTYVDSHVTILGSEIP